MKKNKSNKIKLKDPKEYLSDNLSKLLEFHQMNESDLAKSLQIPYNTIHRLLTGTTSDPRVSTLQQIADYFGVTLDYLLNQNGSAHFIQPHISHNIPVFDWISISNKNFAQVLEDKTQQTKWMQIAPIAHVKNYNSVFAIESTKSMQPRFPSGTLFIVNMDEQPIDGDFIFVRFKDNSVSFRELIIDSPKWQLNATIPGSEPLIFDPKEHEIVGVTILTFIQTRSY
ncbi:MAG: helix-turn-helix domain-containing protein [Legionella sp.]|nr:helix-turn-helix domain-containing protein [Legionella sp.]